MASTLYQITDHNGETSIVQTTLEDRLKFETVLRKNKSWGDLRDNALKLPAFLAWSAASRTGATDLTWEQFTTGPTAAQNVEAYDPDDDGDADEVEGLGKDTPMDLSTTSP